MAPPTDDPLVSTDWLAAHIDDPKVRIIDASFKLPGVLPLPVDDYLTGHIPGAVFFDVDAISDHDDPRPHMYPDAGQFARDVAALGISNGDTVVAYDSGGWVAAPRAWWMFLSFGHPNVKVLDGGLKKWLREGRPTHAGKVTAKPGKFLAKFDSSYLRSQQQLVGNLTTHAEQLVDARPRPRFEGSVAEPRPGLRGGHIPGSRNVPYAELFDASTGAMKPLEELRKAFTGAGVDMTKPIVTTCGSGVSALVLTLALYRLGVRGSALYDGSWSEWGLPDGPPVATGPAGLGRIAQRRAPVLGLGQGAGSNAPRLGTAAAAGCENRRPNGSAACCCCSSAASRASRAARAAIRRRWAARLARSCFLTTLGSSLAPAAFSGGFISTVAD
jgi:thiosulfate/3-mercaptopyruvate sulfurtransferase